MWRESVHEVARYVVCSLRGETDEKASKEARMYGDALGTTPRAGLSLRWVLDDGGAQASKAAPVRSRRARWFADLHVMVDDGP